MKKLMTSFAVMAVATSAFAADFQSKYDEAYGDFLKRGETTRNAETCGAKALEAFGLATTDVQKYDALVLQSRCVYFVGMKTKGDDAKIRIFGEGKNIADRAKAFQKDRAEAYFFYGINL